MNKNIVMLGIMGAGKGTQALRLAEFLQVPHISTGEMFRAAAAEQTPLGLKAKKIMESGALVSDEIVVNIVRERLNKSDARDGFILDGFPRTIEQARELEKFRNIDKVFYLDISEDEALKRITGRRECADCKQQYNVYLQPDLKDKCLKCSGPLISRADDKRETVKKRIDNYKRQTMPLKDYYEEKGILEKIEGEKNIEEIFENIKSAL
ncbi:MAG: adenylate kinase [Elusimicrobiota bacterium]